MIEVRDLNVRFRSARGETHAVKSVSFDVRAGEALGIVGESGCGKSTILRSLAGLETRWTGSIAFNGKPMPQVHRREDFDIVQMVFQDPYASLHPRHRIGRALKEPLIAMKRHCSIHLPNYMIPDRITFLERLPATSTDKVDYQKLKALAVGEE